MAAILNQIQTFHSYFTRNDKQGENDGIVVFRDVGGFSIGLFLFLWVSFVRLSPIPFAHNLLDFISFCTASA